jgi:hypothetical protein
MQSMYVGKELVYRCYNSAVVLKPPYAVLD